MSGDQGSLDAVRPGEAGRVLDEGEKHPLPLDQELKGTKTSIAPLAPGQKPFLAAATL